MRIVKSLAIMLTASLLLTSCASVQKARNQAQIVELQHMQGTRTTCLANCVDMVLDYYGLGIFFAKRPGMSFPANLLIMDSLIHELSSPSTDDPYRLQSFVMQSDETLLQEQLARKRPVIVIFKTGKNLYHSVVVSGTTADHRAYFVNDPAKRKGDWVRRASLLKRWKTTQNTMMLIAISPAGT